MLKKSGPLTQHNKRGHISVLKLGLYYRYVGEKKTQLFLIESKTRNLKAWIFFFFYNHGIYNSTMITHSNTVKPLYFEALIIRIPVYFEYIFDISEWFKLVILNSLLIRNPSRSRSNKTNSNKYWLQGLQIRGVSLYLSFYNSQEFCSLSSSMLTIQLPFIILFIILLFQGYANFSHINSLFLDF